MRISDSPKETRATSRRASLRARGPERHAQDARSDDDPYVNFQSFPYLSILELVSLSPVPSVHLSGPPKAQGRQHGEALRKSIADVRRQWRASLAQRFGVMSIPNFVVLKGGLILQQQAGVAPAAQMERWLERAGAAPA